MATEKWYGNWVYLRRGTRMELDDAKLYLKLWKQFLLEDLPFETLSIEEQWVQRDMVVYENIHGNKTINKPTIGLKIGVIIREPKT